jgi:hypothetical protein
MSDTTEKTYTAADVRSGYVNGALYSRRVKCGTLDDFRAASVNYCPDPKKPREVKDSCGNRYRFAHGALWGTVLGDCDRFDVPLETFLPTIERIKIWADLLEHPYE